MRRGYLSMVLHAHLPFVRHERSAQALEERWLFEALSETYLPLLAVWECLERQNVPFAFALTISPTLLSLLSDEEMADRYVFHLQNTIQLTEKELVRTKHEPEVYELARMYRARWMELLDRFERYGRNIVPHLVKLADSGHLELLTCAATHGFLPVLGTEESRRAQIRVAVDTHRRLTGRDPRGIWLPECGYFPGIESVLESEGIHFFLVDSHAFASGEGELHDVYAPLKVSRSDVYALARDPESAKQVWSSFVGYPGDPDYREYYRDIGFDLEWEYIRDFVHPEGIRVNTGIKYHRVTGQGVHKELYRPEQAKQKCRLHAAHFIESRVQAVTRLLASGEERNPPLIVSPFDAELFGHWWYEGPQWLEQVALLSADQELTMITPSAYLEKFPQAERAELTMSSWGRGGYADVWVNEENDWMYPHLHRLEERLIDLIRRKCRDGLEETTKRALLQMAREVLLAEASDWAFIMTMGTTVQYAERRTHEHLSKASALADLIECGLIPESYLRALETASPIFPELDLQAFVAPEPRGVQREQERPRLRVLMLAWEFPPRTVGGLARHVYDLSRALVEQGVEVHVVTCHGDDTPEREVVNGVFVHRVHAPAYEAGPFVEWMALLNIRLAAMGSRVLSGYGSFDLIHAHDWLVAESATLLAEAGRIPLVTTIHATEHGRHHGIHNDLQRQIYDIERELTQQSQEVIVCSQSMRAELRGVYVVPDAKLSVLPNGVDIAELTKGIEPEPTSDDPTRKKTVFYIGRLVPEKGVQVLLEAAPAVLQAVQDVRIQIAGKGPMLAVLQEQAQRLNIAHAVDFLGFVNDEERNRLIQTAGVAVFPSLYEPFGIVALEAMGLGTPTVVGRTGGLAEIVEHGVDGWLVEPGDAKSLAETLISALTQPEHTATVAQNGLRKTITQYGWSAIATGTLEVYEKALISNKEVSRTGAPDTEKSPVIS